MTSVRILDAGDVRDALDMGSCIDACERAFAAYSAGDAELPGVIHLDVPESGGEIHVKAGHLHGEPFYAVKVASGFARAGAGSAIDGLVAVFDARDGSTTALLLDGGYITDLRTGAAGGVAARHLAPERVERVAMIGTGAQVRMQLDALEVVRPGFTDIRIWGRNAEHARACVEDMAERFADAVVRAAFTVDDAIEDAQVVITCTAARGPLVGADRLAVGAHVTALGSDGAGKQELDPEILRRADVLVADSRDQCASLGELQHAPDQRDRTVEMGEICAGTVPGRTDPAQLTVCDLTGVGVQDVAAANVVMARAGDSGRVIDL